MESNFFNQLKFIEEDDDFDYDDLDITGYKVYEVQADEVEEFC